MTATKKADGDGTVISTDDLARELLGRERTLGDSLKAIRETEGYTLQKFRRAPRRV